MMAGWIRKALAVGLGVVLLAGCASAPDAHPADPWEGFNRQVSGFNDAVDTAVLKPVATTYRDVVPSPVRTGVNNFFGNLGDVWSAVNAMLQLRPREATENLLRFNVNTILGLGGLLDIASEMGIPRTKLDLGLTLGRWGVPTGPYLVLPIFGPSSVRDAGGFVVDLTADPLSQVSDVPVRNSLTVLRVVDTRAGLLRATSMLGDVALDPYSFTRDVYLQRRQTLIEDIVDQGIGVPPIDRE